jgi:hypothetical protein
MHKLIVVTDPVNFTQIFEVLDNGNAHKISQLALPQDSLEFIKNYSNSVQEEIEVDYRGPADYIKHFVTQANQLEFVKAKINSEEVTFD